MSASTDAPIQVATNGSTRVLTLNRPLSKNALNTALLDQFVRELQACADDPAIRAIVLTGAGNVFCAGADLKEFSATDPDRAEKRLHRTTLLERLIERLETSSVPVIAAVNGAAVGAGAGIVLASDMVLVSDSAHLAYPEAIMGIVPELFAQRLRRQVGEKAAFEILATGMKVGPRQCKDLGIANAVAAPADLMHAAMQMAASFSSASKEVIAGIKASVRKPS